MHQQRNFGCRITEYEIHGKKAVSIENQLLRVSILADMGATIYEFLYKPTDIDFLFRDRIGLERLKGFIPTVYTEEGNFWDYHIGGWYELFPNSGRQTQVNNAQIGRHGEIMLLPWDFYIKKDTPDEVEVVFTVKTRRTPFKVERSLKLKAHQASLFIEESLTNLGGVDAPFLWGHHITFGEAFLNENCVINMLPCKFHKIPRYDNPKTRLAREGTGQLHSFPGKSGGLVDLSLVLPRGSGVGEMLFVDQLTASWFTVTDQQKKIGFGLSWDKHMFENLWFCEEFDANTQYPFYGNSYYLALEPQVSNTPVLSNAIKDNSAKMIKAGEQIQTWLTAVAFQSGAKAAGISKKGHMIFDK